MKGKSFCILRPWIKSCHYKETVLNIRFVVSP
uniref:Uncharacterized protein n=1 Tax=Arundo donax TaxID=35708 RepID=A0A0A9GQH2_ARUDO